MGHVAAPRCNETAELPPLRRKDQGGSPSSRNLSDLSGPRDVLPEGWDPPARETEAQSGHVYHLAKSLDRREVEYSEDVYTPFPSGVPRVPVPNRVFDEMDDLSGCAVRLSLLMIREAYEWHRGRWTTPIRFVTRSDLQPCGMSRESVRRAADELEEMGWISIERGGHEHAYRWLLSVPQSSFTYLPLPLLHEAHRIDSHSALSVLLCVYDATWGWTKRMGEGVHHQASAALSASEIGDRCGLSKPTVRAAASDLEEVEAIRRGRPHGGASFFWSPLLSFFHNARHNSFPSDINGSSKEIGGKELCNHNPRAQGGGSCSHVNGEDEGGNRRDTALSEQEKRDCQRLVSDPFGLPFHVAARQVSRWSSEVLQATLGAFERRKDEINNPGGWVRSALEEGWFSKTTTETGPDRSKRAAKTQPMARAFADLAEKNEGWEWDENGGCKNLGGGPDAGGDPVGLSQIDVGRICRAMDVEPTRFEPIDCGDERRFVPGEVLSHRAKRPSSGPKWARSKILITRRDYEQVQ